jgi:hypothetical protein
MVRHKATGPHLHVAFAAPFGHQGKIGLIVFIPKEGIHSPVAALGDVVGDTEAIMLAILCMERNYS